MRTAAFIGFASLALSSVAAAQPPAPVTDAGATLLNITAEGQSRRAPDIALFSGGVVTQAASATAAFSANATRMRAVIDALKRAGIADRDIQTSAISLQPRYSDPQRDAEMRARASRQPYVPPRRAGSAPDHRI